MKDRTDWNDFSRRTFLQGSATLAAGLTISKVNLFGLSSGVLADPPASTNALGAPAVPLTPGSTLTYNVCGRNCHDTCSLIAEKVDGRLVRLVGDPTNPITAGTPCVKGHTHLNVLYHPDRLLYPMKRAGKKG